MVTFSYFGHACFTLSDGKTTLLFDPFFTNNPLATITADQVECQYILVSHAHFDHLGDAVVIAKRTGATIISTAEVAHLCADQGCTVHGMNLGGSYRFDFGKVRVTFALHSSGIAGGTTCGFVLHFGDQVIYFAGDTALFGDMKLIGHKEKIDYALLPIGDNFTMGLEDAAMAAQWLNAKHVIPIHYNTWPPIAQDPEKFKELAESTSRAEVHIVSSGNSLELK